MALTYTPVCDFNIPAPHFELTDPQGKLYSLEDCRGPQGLLVMFICNHCPYVKAILPVLIADTRTLIHDGIGCVAIMPNDYQAYSDDAPEAMLRIAKKYDFPFPYLIDERQSVAKAFGAVCTPDFFGYNAQLALQYRGRFAVNQSLQSINPADHELLLAMREVAKTGQGPELQKPSMGCSIKWR